jgi:hypothetical protein
MNDMIESLGRKLINGDVIELPHMRDFYPLDSELPAALRRYYVVQDGNRAAEGFSPTWYPHLWRVKCTPLVDSQEYRSIFDQTAKKQDGSDVTGADNKLRDLLSTYKQELEINTAIITEAEKELPKSGYDTSSFFVVPTNNDGTPADPEEDSADTTTVGASSTLVTADEVPVTPSQEGYDSPGGMAGDGIAPNGYPVTPSTTFPSGADIGDFVLRLDYKPNRLFRYDGKRWVKVEDAVRTSTTGGAGSTQKDGFVNNTSTYTDDDGTVRKSRQRLSDVLTPEEDN